jgi:hypothetical protein
MRRGHWHPADLEKIAPLVDAIEVFNSRCMSPEPNRQAQAFASEHHLPGTVGSDAHAGFEVGRSILILPDFGDPPGLKAALEKARSQTRLSSPFVHFASRYAAWVKEYRENRR